MVLAVGLTTHDELREVLLHAYLPLELRLLDLGATRSFNLIENLHGLGRKTAILLGPLSIDIVKSLPAALQHLGKQVYHFHGVYTPARIKGLTNQPELLKSRSRVEVLVVDDGPLYSWLIRGNIRKLMVGIHSPSLPRSRAG